MIIVIVIVVIIGFITLVFKPVIAIGCHGPFPKTQPATTMPGTVHGQLTQSSGLIETRRVPVGGQAVAIPLESGPVSNPVEESSNRESVQNWFNQTPLQAEEN